MVSLHSDLAAFGLPALANCWARHVPPLWMPPAADGTSIRGRHLLLMELASVEGTCC
jgi:hypothetical protein